MTELKLFRVYFQGQDHFFDSKIKAKRFGFNHGLKDIVVHRGPDHWRGESDGTSVQMSSSKGTEW